MQDFMPFDHDAYILKKRIQWGYLEKMATRYTEYNRK